MKTNSTNETTRKPKHSVEPLTLVTRDGVNLEADHYKPQEAAKAAIFMTPAMGAAKHAYRHVAGLLADVGYAVVVLNPRGTGASGPVPSRAADFGVREYLHQDWPAAMAFIRESYPDKKVVLLGHSFGGQLNAAYAGLCPDEVDGIVNLCSVWLHFTQLGSLARQLGGLIFYMTMRLSAEIIGYAPGDKIGWGAKFSRQHIRDWSSWGIFGSYRYTGGDMAAALAKVSTPTLAISFSDDRVLGPVKACRRFCSAMPKAALTHWHLTPEEIGKTRVEHFGALKRAETLWQRVDGWITETVLSDFDSAKTASKNKI